MRGRGTHGFTSITMIPHAPLQRRSSCQVFVHRRGGGARDGGGGVLTVSRRQLTSCAATTTVPVNQPGFCRPRGVRLTRIIPAAYRHSRVDYYSTQNGTVTLVGRYWYFRVTDFILLQSVAGATTPTSREGFATHNKLVWCSLMTTSGIRE